jgi:hypothetical protein
LSLEEIKDNALLGRTAASRFKSNESHRKAILMYDLLAHVSVSYLFLLKMSFLSCTLQSIYNKSCFRIEKISLLVYSFYLDLETSTLSFYLMLIEITCKSIWAIVCYALCLIDIKSLLNHSIKSGHYAYWSVLFNQERNFY